MHCYKLQTPDAFSTSPNQQRDGSRNPLSSQSLIPQALLTRKARQGAGTTANDWAIAARPPVPVGISEDAQRYRRRSVAGTEGKRADCGMALFVRLVLCFRAETAMVEPPNAPDSPRIRRAIPTRMRERMVLSIVAVAQDIPVGLGWGGEEGEQTCDGHTAEDCGSIGHRLRDLQDGGLAHPASICWDGANHLFMDPLAHLFASGFPCLLVLATSAPQGQPDLPKRRLPKDLVSGWQGQEEPENRVPYMGHWLDGGREGGDHRRRLRREGVCCC